MRELAINEVQAVSGGLMPSDAMLGMGYIGLGLNVPVIVAGAILGLPTLGLGFLVMTAGIVGTAISGGMSIMGLIASARERKEATPA